EIEDRHRDRPPTQQTAQYPRPQAKKPIGPNSPTPQKSHPPQNNYTNRSTPARKSNNAMPNEAKHIMNS
ncbi:hypothetical protein AAGG49_22410, partial [Stenotrophomonas maltophilia]|uniref:hypothetical protein n=1 Tax=Stenotrophomonas maltophilia TaxID=40324 RepID=UPI00313DC566